MLVDVFRSGLALVLVFEGDIGARPLLVFNGNADCCSVGDGIKFEKYGFELGRGNLERVDLD